MGLTERVHERLDQLVVRELGCEREKLQDDALIRDDLGADSLDMIEVIMEVEHEFRVDIPDEDAEKVRTMGDLRRLVEKLVSPTRA